MLEVKGICKTYEGKLLLSDVSFDLHKGETLCILGPSGSGKSTILRMIAGIENPEKGQILWDGVDVTSVPIHKREFGLVFQDYALFPHKTVFENVAFGLRMKRLPQDEIQQKVREALALVNMEGFEKRGVTDLSGGEQQRIALARALAARPRLLLFDEPLGALDKSLKNVLLNELRDLIHQANVPVVYVTHDLEEAYRIGQRVAVLHQGTFVQIGTPLEVYRRPVSLWVADFLGERNHISGEVQSVHPLLVNTPLGAFHLPSTHPGEWKTGDAVILLVPGSSLSLTEVSESRMKARVADLVFLGKIQKVIVEVGGLFFETQDPGTWQVGQELGLQIDTGQWMLYQAGDSQEKERCS